MKVKKRFIALLLILFLLPVENSIISQSVNKPSRQASLDSFSKGNYEVAYEGFSQLLAIYPKDPSYKYYTAACLVRLNRQPAVAQKYLEDAMGVRIKALPQDILFYLGRARQQQGNYKGAMQALKEFAGVAGKKTEREYNVDEYITQCKKGIGKLGDKESSAPVQSPKAEIPVKPAPDTASVKITQPVLLPEAADNKMNDELNRKISEDSVRNEVAKKKTLPVASSEDFKVIKTDTVKSSQEILPIKQEKENLNTTIKSEPVISAPVVKESAPVKYDQSLKPTGVFSVFEMLPAPVNGSKEKIEINPSVPDGLIYRIQMGVFRNPVNPAFFKGITPIYGFKPQGGVVTTYYAGLFRKMADAAKALNAVKAKGFKDSFISGLMASKPVTSDRAAVLEKEWGGKPLYTVTRTDASTKVDTLPPALVFRVEVARSLKPLNEDSVENLRKLAGNRGLDVVSISDGTSAYIIGNFITFESAEEYSNLLTRNGYRDAKVVAWLGRKEIDVDTARKLFENLQ